MDKLKQLIIQIIANNILIEAILSNKRTNLEYNKVIIMPVTLKNSLCYQFSFYYNNKVIHQNLNSDETCDKLNFLLTSEFKQANLFTKDNDIQILISKKYKVSILKKAPSKVLNSLDHNRTKNYLINEGTAIDFLVELGVMTKDGKVIAKKYDKFKQINRFAEMIADIIPYLNKTRQLNIIDFGCGKSYLTFVIYHYLKNILELPVSITGLDLKEDVINDCNLLADKLGFENLKFYACDIANYTPQAKIDMVVTLHACDTATDAALEKAIKWDSDVILSVPCCHHELNSKLKNDYLEPMLKYGLLKERFAALATDAIRANLLEISGYKVQILEFIDMEHTPKNILIRAVKDKEISIDKKLESYKNFKNFLNTDLYLENALKNDKF